MRSGVNHGVTGRQTERNWHNEMSKHVDAVLKRAKERERRTTLAGTSRRVPQRLTRPISPHRRLKERAGFWMFAKQSEIIAKPNTITSSIQRRVQEDVRAVMTEDSRDRRQMWNIAQQGTENIINQNVVFCMPSSVDNIFGISSSHSFEKRTNVKRSVNDTASPNTNEISTLCSSDIPTTTQINSRNKKDGKNFCLFPADPLLLDYAERILSTLPQLFLRNSDPTSYSTAATGIVACSLRRHGVYPKGSNVQRKQELGSLQRENDTHEKFWRSFFENMSPLNSFSVNSALLTGSSSSSAKLLDFEDIPISSGHVLSNSDGGDTTLDVYQSPKSSFYCSFNDFLPKDVRNDVGPFANLSINSNDLIKLTTMRKDFSANISCNLTPHHHHNFDLDQYHPPTVNTRFERDVANMSDAGTVTNHSAKGSKTCRNCGPVEYDFVEPFINSISNPMNRQGMRNSSSSRSRKTIAEREFALKRQAWTSNQVTSRAMLSTLFVILRVHILIFIFKFFR